MGETQKTDERKTSRRTTRQQQQTATMQPPSTPSLRRLKQRPWNESRLTFEHDVENNRNNNENNINNTTDSLQPTATKQPQQHTICVRNQLLTVANYYTHLPFS